VRHEDYKIEVFVFPDGSQVELIVFDRPARGRGAGTRAPAATPRLKTAPSAGRVPPPAPAEEVGAERCPVCGSTLVYPVDWDRSGPGSWTLDLRCPECETRRDVTLGRASVERLNRELYHGAQELARAAERITRRNFEDETERIVAALERDLILPMDF
jgi:ribosomal protein S27E